MNWLLKRDAIFWLGTTNPQSNSERALPLSACACHTCKPISIAGSSRRESFSAGPWRCFGNTICNKSTRVPRRFGFFVWWACNRFDSRNWAGDLSRLNHKASMEVQLVLTLDPSSPAANLCQLALIKTRKEKALVEYFFFHTEIDQRTIYQFQLSFALRDTCSSCNLKVCSIGPSQTQ